MNPSAPCSSPPVHQHRTWRHLQRAAVAAYPQLRAIAQANFCTLMVPAASIALWILQHAPRLADRPELDILIVNAIEFEALDHGRWFQFIPWLLGRSAMRVSVSLMGSDLSRSLASAKGNDCTAPGTNDIVGQHLRTRVWSAVSDLRPADVLPATLKELADTVVQGERRPPDICVLFTPSFVLNLDTLLTEDGLLPLLRRRVPLALFSTSETQQLVDVYTLEAHGLLPRERDYWPNPWALPTESAERGVVYGKLGWAAEFDVVPTNLALDIRRLQELSSALGYLGKEPMFADCSDAILSMGESLGTAPRDDALGSDVTSELIRLPRGVAVDASNGAVYQLQDLTALLIDAVPPVPAEVLEVRPGDGELLRRVLWAVQVHREHIAPFIEDVDDALRSQFAKLGDSSES